MAKHMKFSLLLLLLMGVSLSVYGKSMRTAVYSRDMQITESGKGYLLSFECPEIFSDRVRQRLSSGFTSRVVLSVRVTGLKGKELIAQGMSHYSIRYDIWEERFAVRVEDLGGRQDFKIRTMDELVKRFGVVRSMYLAKASTLPNNEVVRISVRIVVNPASEELRRKVREYVANPDGRSDLGVPRSFFGSFSRIFVDEKKLQADALLLYQSPPLKVKVPVGGGLP